MSAKTKKPYSGGEWLEIAKAIGLGRPSLYLKRAVVAAAEGYLHARDWDSFRSRRERRKLISSIHDLSCDLESKLRKLDYDSAKLLDSDLTADQIGRLALRAEEALAKSPKKGAEPKKARLQFVGDLAEIYQHITGLRPTRQVKAPGHEYGPFLEFVKAALRPIDPHATTGVETDIRIAIKIRSSGKHPGD